MCDREWTVHDEQLYEAIERVVPLVRDAHPELAESLLALIAGDGGSCVVCCAETPRTTPEPLCSECQAKAQRLVDVLGRFEYGAPFSVWYRASGLGVFEARAISHELAGSGDVQRDGERYWATEGRHA